MVVDNGARSLSILREQALNEGDLQKRSSTYAIVTAAWRRACGLVARTASTWWRRGSRETANKCSKRAPVAY
jgi:hypothetical protein